MAKTKVVKFNVKNLKFSFATGGVFAAPADLAYAVQVTLEADYNEKKLYGDGQIIGIIGDDKGKKGSIVVTNIEQAYEIACGRARLVQGGSAEVQQRKTIPHAIYFETDAFVDGDTVTFKNWLFEVITGKPSESYQQTEDDPTVNTYSYPLTALGTNLKAADGLTDYVDDKGNTVKVFRIVSAPEDTGYATFGDTVPTPKVPAA